MSPRPFLSPSCSVGTPETSKLHCVRRTIVDDSSSPLFVVELRSPCTLDRDPVIFFDWVFLARTLIDGVDRVVVALLLSTY